MEFWASTFKFSSDLAEMQSKVPNLIQNTVEHVELKFQLLLKSKKFLSGNFIFGWPDVTEYLLDLDEKWMVREVDICSFRGVSRKNDGLGVKGLKSCNIRSYINHKSFLFCVQLKTESENSVYQP